MLAHLHQHGVAGGMSVLIVDLLEVVDVDQEEDQVGVLGRGAASAQLHHAHPQRQGEGSQTAGPPGLPPGLAAHARAA